MSPNHSSLFEPLTVRLHRGSGAHPDSVTIQADALSIRTPNPSPLESTTLGPYRVVREVGRGGVGVVYEAMDVRLNRRVALKVLLERHRKSEEVSRFRLEATAAAALDHPNIVRVYEVGETDGQHYVALEFLEGDNLLAASRTRPLPPRIVADLVCSVAGAVEHAHRAGVVHRDIKPANILLSATGIPKLTDFGAARLLDGVDSGLTMDGEVIGTPQYMAPEQAHGRTAQERQIASAPAVDVYALGAVLYHLLTGRPPHDGHDLFAVMLAVTTLEPVPVRRLNAGVPQDLETICHRCLAKMPSDRYPSAAAVSEDLRRFLSGESILARPDGTFKLWHRAARRKPLLTGLIVAVFLATTIGLIGIVWQWNRAAAARDAAEIARLHESIARADVESALRIAERNEYRAHLSEAATLLTAGECAKARTVLDEVSTSPLRNWEFHHLRTATTNSLWSASATPPGRDVSLFPHAMEVSPDGKRVAISAANGDYNSPTFHARPPAHLVFLRVSDGAVETIVPEYTTELAEQIQWLGNDRLVVSDPKHGLSVYSTAGALLKRWPPQEVPRKVRLSPDGRWATSGPAVTLWDVANWEAVPLAAAVAGTPLLVSTDGAVLVVTPTGLTLVSPKKVREFPNVAEPCDLSADGATLVGCTGHEQAHALVGFEVATGRPLWLRSVRDERPVKVKISTVGGLFAERRGGSNVVRVWNLANGEAVCECRGHRTAVPVFGFSPDGRWVATGGNDGTIRTWNVVTGSEVAHFNGNPTGTLALAFTPDGTRLISGGAHRTTFAWDLTGGRGDGSSLPGLAGSSSDGGAYFAGIWSATDGLGRLVDTHAGTCTTFEPSTGNPTRSVKLEGLSRRIERTATDFALSGDGRWLIGPASQAGGVTLWDTQTGAVKQRFPQARGRVVSTAISVDGKKAAASTVVQKPTTNDPTAERHLVVWDTATGKVLRHEQPEGFNYSSMAFLPDGRLALGLASITLPRGGVDLWDLERNFKTPIDSTTPVTILRHIAVSHSGRLIAAINLAEPPHGFRVHLWDTHTGKVIWENNGLGLPTGLAFAPDEERLFVARLDDATSVVDLTTGRELLSKSIPRRRFGDYAFPARVAVTPDGTSVMTYHSDGSVSIWRASRTDTPAERQALASARKFYFHLLAAEAQKPNTAAFRLHNAELERLPPPNDFLRDEWERLKKVGPR